MSNDVKPFASNRICCFLFIPIPIPLRQWGLYILRMIVFFPPIISNFFVLFVVFNLLCFLCLCSHSILDSLFFPFLSSALCSSAACMYACMHMCIRHLNSFFISNIVYRVCSRYKSLAFMYANIHTYTIQINSDDQRILFVVYTAAAAVGIRTSLFVYCRRSFQYGLECSIVQRVPATIIQFCFVFGL